MDPIYNPLTAENLDNPYPVFSRMRDECPVYWHEQMRSWVLTRYDDCRSVLKNHEVWARDWRRVGDIVSDFNINVQAMDPPEVLPFRSGFVNAFRVIGTQGILNVAKQSVQKALAEVKEKREFCLMQDFAKPVAEQITCQIFGVEHPGFNEFHEIAFGIALQMDSGLVPEQKKEGPKVAKRLRSIVQNGFQLNRPGGLFNAVSEQFADDKWNRRTIECSMEAMVNAAYSTIYTSIGNATLALLQNPGTLAEFTDSNLNSGCEELIRFDSAALGTSRVATREVTISGIKIPSGDVVITMFAAANRDPSQFSAPDSIILTRNPNQHLGFGWGVHSCLGTEMARIVLREFVSCLSNLGDIQQTGPAVRFRTATLRWLKSLPMQIIL